MTGAGFGKNAGFWPEPVLDSGATLVFKVMVSITVMGSFMVSIRLSAI